MTGKNKAANKHFYDTAFIYYFRFSITKILQTAYLYFSSAASCAAYQFGIRVLYTISLYKMSMQYACKCVFLMIVWIIALHKLVWSFTLQLSFTAVRLSYYADIMKFPYGMCILNITEFLSHILIIIHSHFDFAQLNFRVTFKLKRAVLALDYSLSLPPFPSFTAQLYWRSLSTAMQNTTENGIELPALSRQLLWIHMYIL